jgi:hypothetical protein
MSPSDQMAVQQQHGVLLETKAYSARLPRVTQVDTQQYDAGHKGQE